MVRRDGGYIKTERIKTIAEKIASGISEAKNHKVKYEGVVLWIEVYIGLRKEKAREYIELACASRDWIIEKGESGALIIRSDET